MTHPGARTPRILVIEDDPGVRRLLVRFLVSKGCVVDEAADGRAGLEALRGGPFDAVVCDVTMPELDGVRLWQEARRSGLAQRTRFVLVSALPLDLAKADRAGVRYLPKPFLLDEVWAEVRAAIGDLTTP